MKALGNCLLVIPWLVIAAVALAAAPLAITIAGAFAVGRWSAWRARRIYLTTSASLSFN